MDTLRNDRFPGRAIRQNKTLHTLAMLGLLLAMLLQAGCASLPTDYPRSTSTALTDTGDTRLGQASGRQLAGHPDVSGVLLLNRGTDAFLARLALAEIAQRSLDIQYYIWHGDTTGKVLGSECSACRRAWRAGAAPAGRYRHGSRRPPPARARQPSQHRGAAVQPHRRSLHPAAGLSGGFFAHQPAHAQQVLYRRQPGHDRRRPQHRG